VGDACGLCASGYMRLTPAGKCVFLPGALSSCHDGVRSSQEEGVDCGGVCDAPCSVTSSFWSQYRVAVLATTGGVGFVAVGIAGLLVHRVYSRRRALAAASASEGEGVKPGRDGKPAGPTQRVGRSVAGMKTKAVHVRPWARESSSTWLDKATPVSPGQRRPAASSLRSVDDGVGVAQPEVRGERQGRARGVDEQHRTAYNGERGTNDGSSVGRVATGRTKAAVRTSAVKPDSEPLVLF
jgi:hypothetical protein